jgi:hypothetical protein
MDIWISLPSCFVPEPGKAPINQEIDAWYGRICWAFTRSVKLPKDDLLLPRTSNMDTEEFAATAIMPLLMPEKDDNPLAVKILADCRSSAAIGGSAPTYRLAAKSGLRKTLPFSLSGQAGSEVAQALIFLKNMLRNENEMAIVSAVQRVVPPDTRIHADEFPLGDATAAIKVTRSPILSEKGFHVLAIVQEQLENDLDSRFETMLRKAVKIAGINYKDIKWVIVHRFSDKFDLAIQKTLPNTIWLSRNRCIVHNLGCPDPLVTLQEVSSTESLLPDGIGAVWFKGRFGAVALILLAPNVRCF